MRKTILDTTAPDRVPTGIESDRLHRRIVLETGGGTVILAPHVARYLLHVSCVVDVDTSFDMDDASPDCGPGDGPPWPDE